MAESQNFGLAAYRAARGAGREDGPEPFDLVARETTLSDRAQVERFLPDIVGRALARAWIDVGFRTRFVADAKATLAAYRLHLPDNILIDVECEGHSRPVVVVNERTGGRVRRLLFLQMVLVAGR